MKSGTMMAYISRMCSQFSHFPRKICSKLYIHVCFIFSNISEEFIRRFIYVFFLQNTIDFRFVQGLGQQKMSGSVSDVVITSASFDKERRASTKSRVKLYSFYLRCSILISGATTWLEESTYLPELLGSSLRSRL